MRRNSFQHLFQSLPTPEEMRAWDSGAVRFGIPEFTLMENAAREALHVLKERLTPQRLVLVVSGGGNNGGDGYALARHLADAGHAVRICHTRDPEALPRIGQTAGEHARLARRAGIPCLQAALKDGRLIVPADWEKAVFRPDVVIDALLGTGFSGPLRELEAGLIRHMNAVRETALLCSLDVPSGLDALTGCPASSDPDAARAHLTVAFEAAKPGLCLPQSLPYTGELLVRPIGIPAAVRMEHPASFRLFAPGPGSLPKSAPTMHKGDAGRVTVIGGSERYAGAPLLAGLGALRGGAGLVTIATPASVRGSPLWPELMSLPLAQSDPAAAIAALQELPKQDALVIGPGLGREEDAAALVSALLALPDRPPVVLDADGLFPLGKGMPHAAELCSALREGDILTPHPGEAAHLLGISSAMVQENRAAALRALCALSPATVVLKGAGTLIGTENAPYTLIPIAAPALAVGGSGDVLAGLVAALMAGGVESPVAACFAVHIHGRAGQLLDRSYPARGNLARDIADALPAAMAALMPPAAGGKGM